VLTHAGLLEILAQDGNVIIRGPVLHREVEKIRDRMHKINGVRQYTLEVDPHESLEHVWGARGITRTQWASRLEAL
jgi:hypothetical protein